jgi:hypothetical protein
MYILTNYISLISMYTKDHVMLEKEKVIFPLNTSLNQVHMYVG